MLDDAKRWFEAATQLCKFVPGGQERGEKVLHLGRYCWRCVTLISRIACGRSLAKALLLALDFVDVSIFLLTLRALIDASYLLGLTALPPGSPGRYNFATLLDRLLGSRASSD